MLWKVGRLSFFTVTVYVRHNDECQRNESHQKLDQLIPSNIHQNITSPLQSIREGKRFALPCTTEEATATDWQLLREPLRIPTNDKHLSLRILYHEEFPFVNPTFWRGQKNLKKLFKNPLTNPSACGIIPSVAEA